MPKPKPLPPVETLREMLSYSPVTGKLTWIKSSRVTRAGAEAGGFDRRGYRRIAFNGSRCLAHRLAWAIHHGVDPGELEIDHRDHDKANNRIDNLRLATDRQNKYNAKTRADNTSGAKGVYWNKDRQQWQAQLCIGGKGRYLGRFSTIEEAEAAVRAAREEHHKEFTHHG
jgi:hypothetical protein